MLDDLSYSLVQILRIYVLVKFLARLCSLNLMFLFLFFLLFCRSDPLLLGPNNQYLSKIISVFAEVFEKLNAFGLFLEIYDLSLLSGGILYGSLINRVRCTHSKIIIWFR